MTDVKILEKLKQALSMVESFKQENESLEHDYDELSVQFNRLSETYAGVRGDLAASERQREKQELSYQSTLSELRKSVQKIQQEYQNLTDRPPTQPELETARLTALKTFQTTHQKRLSHLAKDNQHLSEALVKTRQQLSLLEGQLAAQTEESVATQRENETAHRQHTASLEARIHQLEQESASTVELDRLRTYQRDNNALQLRVQELTNEVGEVRSQLYHAKGEYELALANSQRQYEDQVVTGKEVWCEKEALLLQHRHLAQELEEAHQALGRQSEENIHLKGDLDGMQAKLEECTHGYQGEVQKAKDALTAATIQQGKAVYALQVQLQEQKEINTSLTQTLVEYRERAVQSERQMLDKIKAAQEEHLQTIQKLESKKVDLERSIVELREGKQEQVDRLSSTIQEQRGEAERMKTQAVLLTQERDLLLKTKRELEFQRQTLEGTVHQAEQRYEGAEHQVRALLSEKETLEREHQWSGERVKEVEMLLTQVQQEVVELRNQCTTERASAEATLTRQRTVWEQEKRALSTQLSTLGGEVGGLMGKNQEMGGLLERQEQLYANKLTESRGKVKELRGQLDVAQREMLQVRAKTEAEANEQRQRHAHFLSFLQAETTGGGSGIKST